MSFWNGVRTLSAKAGSAALVAGQKTKLRADLLLVDREINNRKQAFGIELYNHVGPLAGHPSFWEADDPLTNTIRPALLKAQREISALDLKRGRQKERIAQAEVTRQSAFPTPAATLGGKVMNVGKSATYRGNEGKLKMELSMIDTQIKAYKQQFGVEMYDVFVELEDNKGWLPTERAIRSMYDQTRRDIDGIEKKRTAKRLELLALGAQLADEPNTTTASNTLQTPGTTVQPTGGFTPPKPTTSGSYSTPAFADSGAPAGTGTRAYAAPDPFAILTSPNGAVPPANPPPVAPSHEDLLLNFEYRN